MLKVILKTPRYISPFNEPARDLRIQNKPLWLNQRDLLAPYVTREIELEPEEHLPVLHEPMIVYRDNLFFDEGYITEFMRQAKKRNRAVRAAFSLNDGAFREHALPLSISYTPAGNLYYADLWYYPQGPQADVAPLVIDLQAREIGYYHVPTYMASESGDLCYQVPLRAMLAIDCWTHIFIADGVFGLFSRGARFEERLDKDLGFKLRVLATAVFEGKQLLECSKLVKIGKNCVIDPSAVIHGPTTIGDNVTINAGAVIENCIIGSNVNVSQDCQLMLSVVGDGTFLPFRASLFMTTIMENGMVAQNTCLQMCVIGRNTFIGAGNTFTDYNLIPAPIRALDGSDKLAYANRPVLGGCVGHNCRIGAGMVIFPARTIESDVVLFGSKDRRIIDRDVKYEDSDHHKLKDASMHLRRYPRRGESNSPRGSLMDTFAFIIHPIDPKRDVSRKYPFLGRVLSERQIDFFSTFFPPVYISEIDGITSQATGKQIKGWFIACPYTPRRMMELPERTVYRKIIETGHLAEKLGAQILGLGAFTSVVGDAGITIAKALDIPVTTGDAYTVAIAVQAIREAARLMDIPLEQATAAVVGATGSIGHVCAELLADDVAELILIGRREDSLEELRARLKGKGKAELRTSTHVDAIAQAQLILTVTSALYDVIHPEYIRPGSVICDVARPRDVSAMVAAVRDDILVIDGGMVDVPGSVDFHFNFGFPPGKAYACMAETITLALEGRFEDYTLGKEISRQRVDEITTLAAKHGFRLSGFRSFERAVTDEQIDAVRRRARLSRRSD